jgi:chorismate--pyruvate lyase
MMGFFMAASIPDKNDAIQKWLTDPGSFMKRLKKHGVYDARVTVLKQEWQYPDSQERKILQLPLRTYVLVREVMIHSGKKIWMRARTVFPQQALTGKFRQLKNLKSRSLGSVLFKEKNLLRSEFEFFKLKKETWGRRSQFLVGDKKILLTEIFLSVPEC